MSLGFYFDSDNWIIGVFELVYFRRVFWQSKVMFVEKEAVIFVIEDGKIEDVGAVLN